LGFGVVVFAFRTIFGTDFLLVFCSATPIGAVVLAVFLDFGPSIFLARRRFYGTPFRGFGLFAFWN
jgi:hypothetical protein